MMAVSKIGHETSLMAVDVGNNFDELIVMMANDLLLPEKIRIEIVVEFCVQTCK